MWQEEGHPRFDALFDATARDFLQLFGCYLRRRGITPTHHASLAPGRCFCVFKAARNRFVTQ